MFESPVSGAPGDFSIGAFSPEEPWTVDPDHLTWQRDLDALRSRTRARYLAC